MKEELRSPGTPTPSAGKGHTPAPTINQGPLVTWLKLAPRTKVTVYCCSDTWFGADTHWAGGRMKMHTMPTCRHCTAKSPLRFYAFLHVASPNGGREYLVQLSAANLGALTRAHGMYGTLRTCKMELARPGTHANSPTILSITAGPIHMPELPPEIDIAEKLHYATDAGEKGLAVYDAPEKRQAL